MKKKLNSKFMLIAAIAILVTAVCSIGLFYSILVQQIYDDLKANAHVISRLDFEDASQEVCDQKDLLKQITRSRGFGMGM